MSVYDNMAFGLKMRKFEKAEIAKRVKDAADILGIGELLKRKPRQLSGGQRQRVALGRALAVDPSLLLLDEPMSNLDYKVRLELRHELRALQQRVGITAVYVTHDREEALTLADRIAVIDAGRIVQYGTPEAVFHTPSSAFVAGFMGADNGLDLFERADGTLVAADGDPKGGGRAVRAHFRGDAARLVSAAEPTPSDALLLPGVVAQAFYVGQGYRYRVRTGGTEVWVHAPERMDEGTSACVAVPRAALMLFPRDSISRP
jgi:ABC-type Fe3+/spermidine/putrescine transport system ATPase subunit